MTNITKPMLAPNDTPDINTLMYPVLATPKLDGIRCLVIGGKALSRKFKKIPNRYIQMQVSTLPEGLDGELMLRDGSATFQDVTSAVMSHDGEPDFIYCVFDYVKDTLLTGYMDRVGHLLSLSSLPNWVKVIHYRFIMDAQELTAYEEAMLEEGHEGVMVRSPNGPYKCGRATMKQGFLIKVKRFKDSEAEVIGFEEQLHNANEATTDELGHTKRSKHQENMLPAGTLGKFIVREIGNTPWKGKEFRIGSAKGMKKAMRQDIWDHREKYLGKIITYKYQPHGVKDVPRIPIWKGFRDPLDMS